MATYLSAFVRTRVYPCAHNLTCSILRDYRDMWDELIDIVRGVGLCLVAPIRWLFGLFGLFGLVWQALCSSCERARCSARRVRWLSRVCRVAHSDDHLRDLIAIVRSNRNPLRQKSDAYIETLINGNRAANRERWWWSHQSALTNDELDRMQLLLKEQRYQRMRQEYADRQARIAARRALNLSEGRPLSPERAPSPSPPLPNPGVAHSSARSGSPQRGHCTDLDEPRKKTWMQASRYPKPKKGSATITAADAANREAEKEASFERVKARKAEQAAEEKRRAEEEAMRRHYLDIGRRINREL